LAAELEKPTLKFEIMKTQRLIKSITLALLMITVFGCEKETVTDPISQQEEVSTDHTVNRLSLSDFMGTNTFKSVEKTIIKPKGDQLSYQKGGSGDTDNQFEFTSDEVLSSQTSQQTIYTTPIQKVNNSNPDIKHNLLINESDSNTISYIVTYSATSSVITIQPIVSSINEIDVLTDTACASYTVSQTLPCGCGHYNINDCNGCPNGASYPQTISSNHYTICWEVPAIVSFDPGGSNGGTGGYDSGQNNGYNYGGNSNGDPSPPLYIFEADSGPCDPQVTCPPNYWVQSQAWQEPTEAEEIGLDDFLFSQFISTLPQEQQDFLNDSDNSEIRNSIQNFYTDNNSPQVTQTTVIGLINFLIENQDIEYDEEMMDEVVVGPEISIENMEEFLECFDLSSGAEITIYVDQPLANDDTPFTVGGDKAGHSFIGITQGNVTRHFGFYPEGNASPFNPEDPSVFGDNEGDAYDVSITNNISPFELGAVISETLSYNANYHLSYNNCTDFALVISQLSGFDIPQTIEDWPGGSGLNPGSFGQDIRQLELDAGMSRNTEGGNAPLNNGNCD